MNLFYKKLNITNEYLAESIPWYSLLVKVTGTEKTQASVETGLYYGRRWNNVEIDGAILASFEWQEPAREKSFWGKLKGLFRK